MNIKRKLGYELHSIIIISYYRSTEPCHHIGGKTLAKHSKHLEMPCQDSPMNRSANKRLAHRVKEQSKCKNE